MVKPPRLSTFVLPQLDAGDAGRLEAEAIIDGFEFRDLNLSDPDMTASGITDCEFLDCTGGEVGLGQAHLTRTALTRVRFAGLDASRGNWRAVRLAASRIGALDLHEARLDSVTFEGCKVGYVNARHARLKDVSFVRCQFDELDLLEAEAQRVRFEECSVASLNVHLAKLTDVNLSGAELRAITGIEYLKGAAISSEQLLDLAGALAAAMGLEIEDADAT